MRSGGRVGTEQGCGLHLQFYHQTAHDLCACGKSLDQIKCPPKSLSSTTLCTRRADCGAKKGSRRRPNTPGSTTWELPPPSNASHAQQNRKE